MVLKKSVSNSSIKIPTAYLLYINIVLLYLYIPRKVSRVLAKTSRAILFPTGTFAGFESILKESLPATTVMSLLMMAVISSTDVGIWGSNMI